VSRALVVVNPAAGGGRTGRLWPTLRDDLQRAGLSFECVETAARGDAVRLARAAAVAGVELIVAVGGDGTLNEVVSGVAGGDGPLPRVGAILTGRGRDAARNVGLAADPRVAARRLVDGEDVTLDLLRVEWPDGACRWAVNAAGAGFDATVAARASRGGGRGTLPYVMAVLGALAAHAPVEATLDADGERVWSGPLTAAVVANGAYFGGGMKIAPAADPGDGRLDLVVLGALGRLELLRWLPSVYRGGHLANPKIVARAARRVTLAAARPLPVHVDGEPAPPTPVTFRVSAGALRLRR